MSFSLFYLSIQEFLAIPNVIKYIRCCNLFTFTEFQQVVCKDFTIN